MAVQENKTLLKVSIEDRLAKVAFGLCSDEEGIALGNILSEAAISGEGNSELLSAAIVLATTNILAEMSQDEASDMMVSIMNQSDKIRNEK